jgi:hypothetical protein
LVFTAEMLSEPTNETPCCPSPAYPLWLAKTSQVQSRSAILNNVEWNGSKFYTPACNDTRSTEDER